MARFRAPGWCVVIAACLAGVAACSGSSSAPSGAAPTTPAPTSPSTSAQSPAAIAVAPADMGAGWQMKLIPGGTAVAGQVTLDLCGGRYTSEGLRVARRQIALKKGPVVLSNEVVRYRGRGAAEAYSELKGRAAHCPAHPVVMPEQGNPRLRFAIGALGSIPGLVQDTVAVRITVSDGKQVEHGFGVYQFAGSWLAAVYSFRADHQTLLAVTRAASVEARRLRAIGGTAT